MLQDNYKAALKSHDSVSEVLNLMLYSTHQERKLLGTIEMQLSTFHPEVAHVQLGMRKGTEVLTCKNENKPWKPGTQNFYLIARI